MLQNHLRKLIEIMKVESFFLNWVFNSNRQFFKFFLLVILMIFGELLLYASDGETQSDEKPLSANLFAESLEKEEAGDIPPLIKQEDKIIEQEENPQATNFSASFANDLSAEDIDQLSLPSERKSKKQDIREEDKREDIGVMRHQQYGQLLLNIDDIRDFSSFVNIWVYQGHSQKCFDSYFLEEIERKAREISEKIRSVSDLASQEEFRFNLCIVELLRKFRKKNEEILEKLTREGSTREGISRIIGEKEIHSIPQRFNAIINKHFLFEPQYLSQDPYGYLLLSFYETEEFICFIKKWECEDNNEKYFENRSLEKIESSINEMIEPLRRKVNQSNEDVVIYYEISKFSSYVINQLEQFRQRNQGKLNRLIRRSMGQQLGGDDLYTVSQKLDFAISKYHSLKENAEAIIERNFILSSSKFKGMKDRLAFDDACQISIMLRSTAPYVVLGIKNEEKGINARIFLEKGIFSFPARKEASLLSYINPLTYLPRRGANNTYNLGCLMISIDPNDFLAVAEESLRPWIVKSSYVAMALDKMIADSRESKKCIENLDDYSEEYTNDRYFFSQLLKDFLQIRPTDPIPELRSRCSSNEEIKRYFFGKAKYLPGYRPPNSIF